MPKWPPLSNSYCSLIHEAWQFLIPICAAPIDELCSERAGHFNAQAAEVEIEDVSRAYTLFIDVKRSTEFLIAHESDYMFNQVRSTTCSPCIDSALPCTLATSKTKMALGVDLQVPQDGDANGEAMNE